MSAVSKAKSFVWLLDSRTVTFTPSASRPCAVSWLTAPPRVKAPKGVTKSPLKDTEHSTTKYSWVGVPFGPPSLPLRSSKTMCLPRGLNSFQYGWLGSAGSYFILAP